MSRQAFFHPFPVQRQPVFRLVEVFHESQEFIRNYTLPFNMISICLRSEGTDASVSRNLKTGDRFSMQENDISLIPCNLSQEYCHTTRNERYGIHFKLELYPGVDVFSGVADRITENLPEFRREAEEIFSDPDPVRMCTRCQEFALRFCLRHWPAHSGFHPEKIKPFEEILHFIQNKISAELTVEEIAEKIHRSPENFTRSFRAVFQRTPKQFLQELLFRKAAQMLLDPEESVKSVADSLNFSSEFYFSKFFKRLSGFSPREFRSSSVAARRVWRSDLRFSRTQHSQ